MADLEFTAGLDARRFRRELRQMAGDARRVGQRIEGAFGRLAAKFLTINTAIKVVKSTINAGAEANTRYAATWETINRNIEEAARRGADVTLGPLAGRLDIETGGRVSRRAEELEAAGGVGRQAVRHGFEVEMESLEIELLELKEQEVEAQNRRTAFEFDRLRERILRESDLEDADRALLLARADQLEAETRDAREATRRRERERSRREGVLVNEGGTQAQMRRSLGLPAPVQRLHPRPRAASDRLRERLEETKKIVDGLDAVKRAVDSVRSSIERGATATWA